MVRHTPDDKYKKDKLRRQIRESRELTRKAELNNRDCLICNKGKIRFTVQKYVDILKILLSCTNCDKTLQVEYSDNTEEIDLYNRFIDSFRQKPKIPKTNPWLKIPSKNKPICSSLCLCYNCIKEQKYCKCPCPSFPNITSPWMTFCPNYKEKKNN